ncbi:ATP synthase F0 subunit A [Candidatus Saccharibacteria bacterium CPR2]|nr:ATP synthase F0 subunit A [Candidatus Saccharibacteria bacterium CPR2]
MSWLVLASTDGPHISLKAEPVFTIGSLNITNSMLYGVIIAVAIIILGVIAGKSAGIKPARGITRLFEMGMEFVINLLAEIMGSRRKAYKYAPVFGAYFVFIVISYLAGLFPLVGEGVTHNGSPLFRPFTADLNATLALALSAIILVQYFSIKESGLKGHLKHYFSDKPLNPLNFFIGLLEVFGELTRVISLSLRLFFNTAMGDILIAIFAFIGANAATFTLLPIMVFEILVAFIQAYVFTVLSATYLALATAHSEHEHQTEEQFSYSQSQTGLMVEELANG